MKALRLLWIWGLLFPVWSCQGQSVKPSVNADASDKVIAYYFHFSARCITCRTVEAEAKQNIEVLYPDLVEQGRISFKAVNLDEPSNKTIAENLGVNGQTLLLVRGDQRINITNEGFLYARNNPEKFKAVIKELVD